MGRLCVFIVLALSGVVAAWSSSNPDAPCVNGPFVRGAFSLGVAIMVIIAVWKAWLSWRTRRV